MVTACGMGLYHAWCEKVPNFEPAKRWGPMRSKIVELVINMHPPIIQHGGDASIACDSAIADASIANRDTADANG